MRLQVMHLPAPADEYPFMHIADEVEPGDVDALHARLVNIKEMVGASAIFATSRTVEVV